MTPFDLPAFVIKQGRGVHARYSLANVKTVSYPEIRKADGKAYTVAGMTFQPMRGTGRRDKKRVVLTFDRAVSATMLILRRLNVHALIRALRSDERTELARIDEQIASLQERRKVIMQEAWERGHAVTVEYFRMLADKSELEREQQAREARQAASELRRDQ